MFDNDRCPTHPIVVHSVPRKRGDQRYLSKTALVVSGLGKVNLLLLSSFKVDVVFFFKVGETLVESNFKMWIFLEVRRQIYQLSIAPKN